MKFMVSENAVWLVEGVIAHRLIHPQIGTDLSALTALSPTGRETLVTTARTNAEQRAVADLTPQLPIARAGKILCLGHNYIDHVKEGGYDIPKYPAIFMRTTTSLTPAGGAIIRPNVSHRLDFEVELMIVVGKGGRNIKAAEAMEAIFGYTVFNDGTIRDHQKRSHQWTPGKNFDSTGGIGPFVVTRDEIPDPQNLKMTTRLNGEVMQDGTTADMMWKVAQIIEVMSEFSTLEPGDL
ncbi:MAG: fumarylacetoacetate hydrolase family protein, partial [Pikeienuella sp.]